MTVKITPSPDLDEVRQVIADYIQELSDKLWTLNKQIHDEPEIAFEEFKAQQHISAFLQSQGHQVQRGAYNLPTAFESKHGTSGRCVNFNAEYDALPGLGHACGHNLIATAGVAAYLALSFVLDKYDIKGKTQLLGTPAEEDGGGKVLLLDAGAYKDVDVSLMIHPMIEADYQHQGTFGSAGPSSIAVTDLVAEYKGSSAHAAANPWDGINALDALVASYNNVSMLRQQIKPDERIHGCIMDAPRFTNAIPDCTQVKYTVRSASMKSLNQLTSRVRSCIEAGATATGCEVAVKENFAYADLWVNQPLCSLFKQQMDILGVPISMPSEGETIGGSTDMGNVSQAVPGLHGIIGIPTPPGTSMHNRTFAEAAGTVEAHERILEAAKAMAVTGWSIMVDDGLFARIKKDFQQRRLKSCKQ
ncbi:Peptidase M20 domain-containing protein 2 [Fusarium keratoplasticum]|nr:Peptidase M20 domain-containing protein 2 [Fusarium keratoplasticum]